MKAEIPADVAVMKGFIHSSDEEIQKLRADMGLAMSDQDLAFCRDYFRDREHRDPFLRKFGSLIPTGLTIAAIPHSLPG